MNISLNEDISVNSNLHVMNESYWRSKKQLKKEIQNLSFMQIIILGTRSQL